MQRKVRNEEGLFSEEYGLSAPPPVLTADSFE